MARIDKYEPLSGGFRAPLAADYAGSETPVGVGLDVNGRLVVGAGASGVVAIICRPPVNPTTPLLPYKAGSPIDAMTDGELVEFAGVAGTKYYSDAAGVISTTNTGVYVGHTVEATRLVVRVAR